MLLLWLSTFCTNAQGLENMSNPKCRAREVPSEDIRAPPRMQIISFPPTQIAAHPSHSLPKSTERTLEVLWHPRSKSRNYTYLSHGQPNVSEQLLERGKPEFRKNGQWSFHMPPIHIPTKCRPKKRFQMNWCRAQMRFNYRGRPRQRVWSVHSSAR